MLKNATLAILGLAASGFAFAGMMYSPAPALSCTSGDVTVPCEARKWDIGVQALYLQPTYTAGRGYEFDLVDNIRTAKPKWGWGYRLEGSYHSNTGNDLTMTFIHYDNDSRRIGFTGATPFASTRTPFILALENKFDQVNLVLGQHTDMGIWQKARFYGGLQYAKIRVDTRDHYTTVPLALTLMRVASLDQFRNADFNGIGPVIGTDYSFNLVRGFSLTGNTAISILYGSSRYAEGYKFGPSGIITFPANHSQKTIVPSLEAKLGIKYGCELAQGIFNLEGGYQVINYFNALETRGGQSGFNLGENSSNFGLYGPYFGVKWIGNV